jgi:hypothetical protein
MVFDPQAELLQALVSHGLSARKEEGWIAIEGHAPLLRAFAIEHSRESGGVIGQLDVQVGLPDGRLLVESAGAPGATLEDAVKMCFGKFLVASLHPLLGAFFGHREHQEIERWTLQGAEYDAFLGPMTLQASGSSQPPFTPIAPRVKELVQARNDARGAHWCRVFYAQNDNKAQIHEALWDNAPWADLSKALEGLAWPKVDGYYSARHFFVIAPVGDVPAGTHYRELERAVESLASICGKDRALNDDTVVERLVDSGVDPMLAERVITFGPIGFSELILRGAQVSPEYQVMGPTNEIVATKRLVDEPVFVAAREVASALTRRPEGKDPFFSVASRCSRFSAANQALGKGSKLQDLVISAPVVFLRDPPPPRSESKLPAPTPRPWWKVW